MQSIILLFIAAIVCALIGLIVYFIVYNKKANERVTGSYDPANDARIPAPSSALTTFWKVVLVLLLVFLLWRVGDLRDRVTSLEFNVGQLSNRMNYLRMEIINEMENRLETQNSLFYGLESEEISYDWDALTAEVAVRIIPKEMTKDAVLTLTYRGTEYPCVRDGNGWKTTVTVPLLDETDSGLTLTLTDGDTVRNEKENRSLIKDPIHAMCSVDAAESKNGKIILSGSALLFLPDLFPKDAKASVLLEQGGTVLLEKKLEPDKGGALLADVSGTYPLTDGEQIAISVRLALPGGGYAIFPLGSYGVDIFTVEPDGKVTVYDQKGNVILR